MSRSCTTDCSCRQIWEPALIICKTIDNKIYMCVPAWNGSTYSGIKFWWINLFRNYTGGMHDENLVVAVDCGKADFGRVFDGSKHPAKALRPTGHRSSQLRLLLNSFKLMLSFEFPTCRSKPHILIKLIQLSSCVDFPLILQFILVMSFVLWWHDLAWFERWAHASHVSSLHVTTKFLEN